MRTLATRACAINQYNGLGNQLWDLAGNRPSLDLRFADNKSLVDTTTGQNLVTFTRASSGTYVDSQGVIRRATTNLLLRSEEFDNASWNKGNMTVTANALAAPNGTVTADLIDTATETSGTVPSQAVNVSNSTTYILSVYVKTGSATWIRFRTGLGTGSASLWYDINNGSFSASNATFAGVSAATAGDGWRRVVLTVSYGASDGGTRNISITPTSSNGGTAPFGTVYLWGAQLEQSSTVGEYIPTTSTINSAPRFDHDPTTGESLGLLVEESRTNGIRNNTMVGAVAGTPGTLPTNWTESLAGLTREVVGIGTQNGVSYIDIRLSGTSTGTQAIFRWDSNITAAEGQSWAHSAWIARVSGSLPSGSIVLSANLFNASSVYVGDTNGIQIKSLISDSFRRVSGVNTISTATTATARPYIYFLMANGESVDFTLRIGMPQFEQGAFATSVIPTTTAAVTRSADVASITGSNYSGWANNNEGTILSDSTIIASQIKTQAVWELSGGTVLSSLRQPHSTANQFRAVIGGTFTGSPGTGASLTTGVTRAAVAYSGASGRLQVGDSGADATGSALNATSLSIGNLAGSTQLNGCIKRLTYWPTRLANETLQQITQ